MLQIEPSHIRSSGGEITSSRTDNHILFPPDAVGGTQVANISYSEYCLNSSWQGDGCLLNAVQFLPHNIIFSKFVDICLKHHLLLDESCQILVIRSTVREAISVAGKRLQH